MKDKTHIYYWSPFISNVATVNAVLGSIRSLKTYSDQKFEPHVINAAGEWNKYNKELNDNDINIIKLSNSKAELLRDVSTKKLTFVTGIKTASTFKKPKLEDFFSLKE